MINNGNTNKIFYDFMDAIYQKLTSGQYDCPNCGRLLDIRPLA